MRIDLEWRVSTPLSFDDRMQCPTDRGLYILSAGLDHPAHCQAVSVLSLAELGNRVDYLSDRMALVEGSQRRLEQYVGKSTGAGPSDAAARGEDWYYADCNEDADPGGDVGQ